MELRLSVNRPRRCGLALKPAAKRKRRGELIGQDGRKARGRPFVSHTSVHLTAACAKGGFPIAPPLAKKRLITAEGISPLPFLSIWERFAHCVTRALREKAPKADARERFKGKG